MRDTLKDDSGNSLFSRREWLGKLALPATGAVLAAGFMDSGPIAAAQTPSVASPVDLGARVYNIRSYGAKGDNTTLDTVAVQAAIDACAGDGGGTVLVPAGTYVIGAVELKSNVRLHIAASGKLLGSADGKQYHAVDAIPLHGDTTLNDGNWALLYAVNAKNFSIEGPGVIDGQGAQFHSPTRGVPPPSGLGGNRRPYHVLIYRCENFSIRNISLLDCAYHSIRVIQSQRAHMESIYIHNRVNSNNDGFHFISAEHVTVSNCVIKCGDDACAMFGSCKNIAVTNSYFSTRWSVFRFGGGHAENIAVSNCLLSEVDGCPIKFQGDPGSTFENISFSNLVLKDVTGPISISVGGRLPAPDDKVPVVVRNISFSHIHGTVTTNPASPLSESQLGTGSNPGERHSCIVLNSVNDSIIENISFDDVHLVFGGGGTAEDAATRNVPETFGEYFRLGAMPAYGLYARNVRGITLNNIRFQVSTPDLRPAVIFDHVEDAAFNGFSVQGNAEAESVLRFTGAKHTLLTATRVLTPSATFLQLEGDANDGIIVEGGDLSRASSVLTCKNGATEKSVKLRNVS
jgi:polygalacturonase